MAKRDFLKIEEEAPKMMTAEEAKTFRASLYKPKPKILTNEERRAEFKLYWARERKKYGKSRELEHILWTHLMATGNTEPEKFGAGISHFGLKKIK